MKKLLLVVFAAISFSSIGQKKEPTPYCLTGSTSLNDLLFLKAKKKAVLQNQYCVKIYVHVVRRSDGTGGQTNTNIEESISIMRDDFESVTFQWDNTIIPLHNTSYYENLNPGTFFDQSDIGFHQDGIDIYFFDDTSPNGFGFAADNKSGLLIKGEFKLTEIPLARTKVISHEMGHVLGVDHTFEGCERLGDDCSSSGDKICDTPIDPNMNFHVSPDTCEWDGNLENRCLYTPQELSALNPDEKNIMAYSQPYCLQYFSEGQRRRMMETLGSAVYLQDVIIDCGNTGECTDFPEVSRNIDLNPSPFFDAYAPQILKTDTNGDIYTSGYWNITDAPAYSDAIRKYDDCGNLIWQTTMTGIKTLDIDREFSVYTLNANWGSHSINKLGIDGSSIWSLISDFPIDSQVLDPNSGELYVLLNGYYGTHSISIENSTSGGTYNFTLGSNQGKILKISTTGVISDFETINFPINIKASNRSALQFADEFLHVYTTYTGTLNYSTNSSSSLNSPSGIDWIAHAKYGTGLLSSAINIYAAPATKNLYSNGSNMYYKIYDDPNNHATINISSHNTAGSLIQNFDLSFINNTFNYDIESYHDSFHEKSTNNLYVLLRCKRIGDNLYTLGILKIEGSTLSFNLVYDPALPTLNASYDLIPRGAITKKGTNLFVSFLYRSLNNGPGLELNDGTFLPHPEDHSQVLVRIDASSLLINRSSQQVKANANVEELTMYPNPFNEFIRFKVHGSKKVSHIDIKNVYEKTIFSTSNTGEKDIISIKAHNFKKGIYFMKITFTDGTSIVKQIAKE